MLKTNKTAAKTEIIPALGLYLYNIVIHRNLCLGLNKKIYIYMEGC